MLRLMIIERIHTCFHFQAEQGKKGRGKEEEKKEGGREEGGKGRKGKRKGEGGKGRGGRSFVVLGVFFGSDVAGQFNLSCRKLVQ